MRDRPLDTLDGSNSATTSEPMPKAPEPNIPASVKDGILGRKRKRSESDEDNSDAFPAVKAKKRKQSSQTNAEAMRDPLDTVAMLDEGPNGAECPSQSLHADFDGVRSCGHLPNDQGTKEERMNRREPRTFEHRESHSPLATALPLGVVHRARIVQPGEVVDNSTVRTTSAIRSSSPYSPSSVEFLLSKSRYPPSTYPSHLLPYLVPTSPSQRPTPATAVTEKIGHRFARRLFRYESRLTQTEIIANAQRRFERSVISAQRQKALLKEACMKRELRRAKKTAWARTEFQDIDIHNDNGDEEHSKCEQVLVTQDDDKAAKTNTFAGQIMIQDRLSAMSQALSEHTKDGTLRTEPGRHSFHVDAAVSEEEDLTGIAVVQKTNRQYWASPWTAKGYRIREALDQTEAETWAIWQALQVTIENVHANRAVLKPQDPCYLAVVYSDCQMALQKIGSSSSDGGKVVQKIIAQSMELQRLGVDVHLHWCLGHRNIPGNELADLVSKKGRRPFN